MSLLSSSIVKQCSHIRSEQSIPTQWTLVDSQNGQAHHLNLTASFVWEACDGANSIQNIAEILCTHYDVTDQQALDDVCKVVSHLSELGVVEVL